MSAIQVLLATYNGERYLQPQLDTLQAQTDADFQVLWQDDGYTDGTVPRMRAVSAADARFIPAAAQGEHLGATGNFLSLVRQCAAPYAAFCDQDDLWLPDHLALLRREMARLEAQYGPETPLLVHGDAEVMDAEGQLLHHSFFAHQGWDREARSLNRLLVQNNVTGCTTLLNAPLLRLVAAHARPEELVLHDWFVALTAAAFGQIGFVNAPLLRYRQHGRNVKGASHHSLRGRGVQALLSPRRGRERIALSYRNGEAFLRAYGEALPEEARKTVERYLAIASLGKLRRLQALRAGGYTMQAPVTRLGQILFG